MLCGISPGFPRLSPTQGQVSHVLLTRSPLYSRGCPRFLVRLACVRHAASVDSEPGSNSRLKPDTPSPAETGDGQTVRSLELLLKHFQGPQPALARLLKSFLTTGTFNLVVKDRIAFRLSGALPDRTRPTATDPLRPRNSATCNQERLCPVANLLNVSCAAAHCQPRAHRESLWKTGTGGMLREQPATCVRDCTAPNPPPEQHPLPRGEEAPTFRLKTVWRFLRLTRKPFEDLCPRIQIPWPEPI